jgi:hypothetical protein
MYAINQGANLRKKSEMYAIYGEKIVTLQSDMRKPLLFLAVSLALNASAAQPNDSLDGRYYRLFAPLTFYHNVANKALALDSESAGKDPVTDAIDAALMKMYMKRPDLVNTTESDLKATGSILENVDKPIENQVEFVEEVMQPSILDIPQDIPDTVMVQKPKFWTYKADGFLQFMQNYVSGNWYKGGESNYSMLGALTLEANYDNKEKWIWDNKLELKLGLLLSSTDTLHKVKSNEDLVRLTSKVGIQASHRWYYTLQLQAYTQFTPGYKSNDPNTYSDAFSPFNLNLGLGMEYELKSKNKRLTGTVNLSPIALNYRYVDRIDLATKYGLDEGKHSMLEFGPLVTANIVWKFNDVISWKSRLFGFTSFKRVEVEWENTFELRVSKYITANLFLFPRFDDASKSGKYDEDLGYLQFREYSSLGFAYTF